MRLMGKAALFGSGRVAVVDSWFASLQLCRLARTKGFHAKGLLKTATAGFCHKDLAKKLKGWDHGAHAVATIEINNERFIACGWKGKSEKSNKGKKRKHFLSMFISTDCTATLPGTPAQKRLHHSDGRRAQSKFVP